MELTSIFLGLPALLFLIIVLMPKGRPALRTSLAFAALLVVLWFALRMEMLPALTQHGDNQTLLSGLFLLAMTMSWFLGSTLQMFRTRLPEDWPGWVWPLMVLGSFGAIGFVVLRLVLV